MISALPNLPNAALRSGFLSLEWSFSVNTRSMLGLSPNGSRQCADTYVSFASLPFPLKTPVTEGFTFAAGPDFLTIDAGGESPALSSATSKLASKPLENIWSVSFGWLALPVTRPSCSLSSPVALPLRRPSIVPPAAALQYLNAPVSKNTSLRKGLLKLGSLPPFSVSLASFRVSLETAWPLRTTAIAGSSLIVVSYATACFSG